MKQEEIKIGLKVMASVNYTPGGYANGVTYYHYEKHIDYSTVFGTIIDTPVDQMPAPESYVWVSWDLTRGAGKNKQNYIPNREIVLISILAPESMLNMLEHDFNLIEAEVKKQVKTKMEEAAAIIREANNLVIESYCSSSLADLYGAIQPLIDSMDEAGWRTSSWNC